MTRSRNTADQINRVNSSAADATAITVDATGAVTKPLQPAFLVKPNDDQSDFSADGYVTVALGTEIFDQASNFASNIFTSPITGRYQLNVILTLFNLDSAAAYYNLELVTSNRTYRNIFDPDFGQDAAYWTMALSVLADMDASDTAYLRIYQASGAAQTDISHLSTHFSGYLVA